MRCLIHSLASLYTLPRYVYRLVHLFKLNGYDNYTQYLDQYYE